LFLLSQANADAPKQNVNLWQKHFCEEKLQDFFKNLKKILFGMEFCGLTIELLF
jgi:hypothetical protein